MIYARGVLGTVSPVERGGRLDTTVSDEPAEPQSASPNTHLSATAAWIKEESRLQKQALIN